MEVESGILSEYAEMQYMVLSPAFQGIKMFE